MTVMTTECLVAVVTTGCLVSIVLGVSTVLGDCGDA